MSKFFLLLFLVVSMRGQWASSEWCERFGSDSLDEWRNGIYEALCPDHLEIRVKINAEKQLYKKKYLDLEKDLRVLENQCRPIK